MKQKLNSITSSIAKTFRNKIKKMLNNKYKQIDEIGKGGFGRVILCLDFSSRIKGKK
jgi:hypothetical protein